MKGGLAALIGSLLALKRAGCPFNGKIFFTAVADEETGSDNGTVWLIRHKGLSADYAIVAEPSDGWIAIGNRGLIWIEVVIKGKAAHGSRPDLGINAIQNAARAIAAIAEMRFEKRNELFLIPTGSIATTMIHGGIKENVIPDRCTFVIDRRLLPDENVDGAVDDIRNVLSAAIQDEAEFELRIIKAWPPVLIDEQHELVTSLVRAFERVYGYRPPIRGKAGSTDASFIWGLARTPVVLYGPGPINVAHMADEYVELESVVKAAEIYTLTTLSLLK